MRHRHALATALVAAALGALAPPVPGGAQTPAPTLTVTPDHDLVDGQSVLVEGSGFPAGQSVTILQCRPGSTTVTDLPVNCEVRTSHTADASGSFSGYQAVERELQPIAGPGPVDCAAAAGACTITAAYNVMYSTVDVPLAFADPSLPTPTLSVSPAVGLEDGDVVSVTGAGFPAGAGVTVTQCAGNRPAAAEWCDVRPPVTSTADTSGGFTGQVTIHQAITLPSGDVVDCVGSACVVMATAGDGGPWATAEIELTRRVLLPIASSPAVVTPQGTVQLDGMLYCSDPAAVGVEVRGGRHPGARRPHDLGRLQRGDELRRRLPALGGRGRRRADPAVQGRHVSVTAWAYEVIDPTPDDSTAVSRDIELVRPPR